MKITMRDRNLSISIAFLVLAGACIFAGYRIWLLFSALSFFYFLSSFSPEVTSRISSEVNDFGRLGDYNVDDELCYGMYIRLNSNPIFIDIRRGDFLRQRENYAKYLYENSGNLERNLNKFIAINPDFSSRCINSLGLHSLEMPEKQAEVFWDPEGYSQIRDLEFFK
ncbi:hypothetical protein ACM9XA_02520 [Xanthomonas sacchari]